MEDDQVIAIPDNDGELLMEETENEQVTYLFIVQKKMYLADLRNINFII